jgi:thioredoxin-like negative regulator of GroEL/mono/diheme cytochrome c family protein
MILVMPRRKRMRWGVFGATTAVLLALAVLPRAATPRAANRADDDAAEEAGDARGAQQLTFARGIAPIIYAKCAGCHHSSEPGALCGTNAFPLLSYHDVKAHAAAIVAMTRTRAMPPWLPEAGYGEFADAQRLSDEQVKLIAEWVREGAPLGDSAAMPPAPKYSEGWQLGTPDLILEAPRALTIPASGPDVFWNFIFSPGIKTARYVRAIEIRPGSDLSLVHHANIVLDPARSALKRESTPGAGFPGMDLELAGSPLDIPSHFLFWKPGGSPWVEPSGLAWRLDPGTDLVLNAHFMPIGTREEAKPSIGLYFTDEPPKLFPMLIEMQNDEALDIPAGARDFVVSDSFRLPVDADVLGIYPHAHYLGHVLEGYATLPDGSRKWLIRIPDWDPKWQAVYHYREPVFLPKGTAISMRYHFDNSAANPRNPNSPPRRVRGGNQSTDEMAHLWLQLLPRGNAGERFEIESALLEHRIAKYRGDFASRLDLGALMLARLDAGGAVPVLEGAVQIDPKQEEARRFLGVALASVGRTPEAIAQFRMALTLDARDEQARYSLARELVKAGKIEQALENFHQVAAGDPKNAQLRVGFGELLLQRGRPAEALEQFNVALAIDPSLKVAQQGREIAMGRARAGSAEGR